MSFLKHPPFTTSMRRLLGDRKYFPLREAYLHYQKKADLWQGACWAQSVERLQKYKNIHKPEKLF